MSEKLRADEIEEQAWNCYAWPQWLHDIVWKTNEVADHLDMSTEQAIAYGVLSALSASSGSAAPVAWQYELFWDRGPDDRRWMTWTSTDKPADSPKVRNVRPLYAAPALFASPLPEEPS